ncbi:MAG: BglG family transcription antiterminator [Anaerorhabdus sp.]
MQLNVRQREIVLQLSEMSTATVELFANQYHISKRMVYSDIQAIKEWCMYYNIDYDTTTILPFINSKSVSEVKKILRNVSPYLTKLSQRTRINLSLNHLLFSEQSVTVEKFSDNLGISRATFYRDTELLKAWLHQFKLDLEINKHNGISITGEETNIREAIVAFIFESMPKIDLIGLLTNQNPGHFKLDFEKESIYNTLMEYFSTSLIIDACNHIDCIASLQSYSFKDQDRIRYIWQVIVSVQRALMGKGINSITNSDDIGVEVEMIKKSFQKYNLADSEMNSLARYLQRLLLLHRENLPSDKHIDVLIIQLIERISSKLHYPFHRDVELMENLKIHIYATIERLKLGIFEFNAIKDEIKENYAELFEIVHDEILSLNLLGQEISEDEISYIVIYFATAYTNSERMPNAYVVCTTGKGSALLLLSNMQRKMPYINILDSINIDEAQRASKDDADLIISTIDFYHSSLPVIIVTPLLLDGEIEKINQALMLTDVTKIKTYSVSDGNQFIEYMQLMTDAANTVKRLEEIRGLLEIDAFIAVMIHLMMQCSQERTIFRSVSEMLTVDENDVYKCLTSLYSKYNKSVSEYDLKSIELYFEREYEN